MRVIELHDGSHLTLSKLEREYDPADKEQALRRIREANSKGEVLTGLFYIETGKPDFIEQLDLHEQPLASLAAEHIRPSRAALGEIMDNLK
jgi:2-oxoglutarate ferredoxin oxidoreductase subunit beta